MFQNEAVAEATGQTKTAKLIEMGVSAEKARELGREAEARKRAQLNSWTRQNVGLN